MSSDLLWMLGGSFVAAFCSGVAGFAFNLVAAGILFHVFPPQQTAPVLVLGSLLAQGAAIPAIWPAISWTVLRPYVLAGLLGTPFGTMILLYVEGRAIAAGIGALLVGYSAYMLARSALRLASPRIETTKRADAGIGFLGGVLGGIGGFSGALPTMWTDLKGLRKDEARAIFQPFIVIMQAVAALGLLAGGLFDRRSVEILLYALPAIALGVYLGLRVYRVIPAEGFRLVLLGLLLVSGISLVL